MSVPADVLGTAVSGAGELGSAQLPTGFLLHPAASLHDPGWGHPEHQGRLRALASAVSAQLPELNERVAQIASDPATREDLLRVHRADFIEYVEAASRDGRALRGVIHAAGVIDDGVMSEQTWERAAAVLARYLHLEAIPHEESKWDIDVRGAAKLASSLREHWENALLFRTLATLRTDPEVFTNVDELKWRGPTAAFAPLCDRLGVPELAAAWSGR